jgi:hypothetical protein
VKTTWCAFIQFIKNYGPLHVSAITCLYSGGATQAALGTLRAEISWFHCNDILWCAVNKTLRIHLFQCCISLWLTLLVPYVSVQYSFWNDCDHLIRNEECYISCGWMWYGMDVRGILIRIPTGQAYNFATASTTLEPTKIPTQWVVGTCSQGFSGRSVNLATPA